HRLPVGADLEIALDRIICRHRRSEGRGGVLDDAPRRIVQPAVGDRARDQPVEAGHGIARAQATSNRPSTSTAASTGSAATPTVVRACLPLSAKTSTMRSEAPFITLGPSRKLGAELMKPPSRTTRTTLSRSPSAALTWTKRLTAQARAAFWPSSTETPAPSLPLATSLPSAPRQIWPE